MLAFAQNLPSLLNACLSTFEVAGKTLNSELNVAYGSQLNSRSTKAISNFEKKINFNKKN